MPSEIVRSILLFALAALCEIGGGYLVWQFWRQGAHWLTGLLGAVTLVCYGIIPTYQAAHFGRVYAAYGGVFIVASLVWARVFDGVVPDTPDLVGALVCLTGVAIIVYWPR